MSMHGAVKYGSKCNHILMVIVFLLKESVKGDFRDFFYLIVISFLIGIFHEERVL